MLESRDALKVWKLAGGQRAKDWVVWDQVLMMDTAVANTARVEQMMC